MKKFLPLPVGVDDFKRLRQEYYFVDKTKFIQSLMDSHSTATLITRPRRFGKTLALSMVYYFFTLKDAEKNRKLFDGCAISRAGERYMSEQGKRPVIFLSLKDIKEDCFDLMLEHLAALMQSVYSSFRYLLEGDLLYPEEKEIFQSILSRKASRIDLQLSLKNLTLYLTRCHHRPTVLLIDEYDAPIQYAWDYGYYDKAIPFYRNYLSSVLKSNQDLDFAVLTGVLRISKESIFSSLNNLKVSSVATGSFVDAMGFSVKEVSQMATDFGQPEKAAELKHWYDGYNFSGQEIYNPWSVINYFDHNAKPGLYWVNTSGNMILAELLKQATSSQERDLNLLMQGGTIPALLDEGVIYSEIHKNSDALYSMLLTTGYLTLAEPPNPYNGNMRCTLRIPNQEIQFLYRREIVGHMESIGVQPQLLQEMMSHLLSGKGKAFEECLSSYLESVTSYYDTANKESFYHGLMLGLLAILIPRYRVVSNRESGYGRFDLAVFPLHGQSVGVLMEFKTADSEEDLAAKAKDALAQIEQMDYLAEFRTLGVSTVWKYGIAFWGKRTCIVAGTSDEVIAFPSTDQ